MEVCYEIGIVIFDTDIYDMIPPSGDLEMLAGNLASIGVGAIIATVSSLIVCIIFCILVRF